MLLQSHALRNQLALLGLLTSFDLFLDQNVVLFALLLGFYQISTCPYSVHKISLQQVVKSIQIEALVKELEVYLFG